MPPSYVERVRSNLFVSIPAAALFLFIVTTSIAGGTISGCGGGDDSNAANGNGGPGGDDASADGSVSGDGAGGGGGDDGGGLTPTTAPCGAANDGHYQLPKDRVTAWGLAGLLSKGGVKSDTAPICNTTPLAPSNGGDDSAAINALIEGCAPGSVAQLAAGTFTMGKGKFVLIDKPVVLRGAGAGVTKLVNPLNKPATAQNNAADDATPIIVVGPNQFPSADGDGHCNGPTAYQTAFMQKLSADGAKGSTSVQVGDASIFKPGAFVLLDETSGASWQPDVSGLSTSIWATPDYAVEWQLHKPASQVDDPIQDSVTPSAANNFAGSGDGKDGACWFCRQDRPQNEIKEIASVSGNTVTFTSPLHKDYRTSHFAELTTYTGDDAHVVGAGVEKLSMQGGGDGSLRFEHAAYSWAKNVEVSVWYGEGVALDGSFRVELRDSYIHDAAWAEPGGAGYAISIADGSSELLIENNISVRANKVMVARSSGTGSVVGYNYMDDGYIATSEGWVEIGLNASHMVGSHHVLFEGNQSFNMDSDDTHGNSTFHTYFRNATTSVRTKFASGFSGASIDDVGTPANGPKRAAGAMRYTYWMSFVGNVLGAPGISTADKGYEDDTDDWTKSNGAIWMLGWNDVNPYTTDPQVKKTAVRDGNWDTFLGKQTWLNASAPAPLPDSCYRTGKPAFFGSNAWPWVDPTTGHLATLPAKARFDAGTPNVVP